MSFASPFTNKRCDEYGGTIQNRARFAVEISRNIKQKCGADFPVLYRMSAVEYVPGGLEIEEAKVLARLVEEGRMTKEQAEAVKPYDLYAFAQSSLAKRMTAARAEQAFYTEQPFVIRMPARELELGLTSDETILI